LRSRAASPKRRRVRAHLPLPLLALPLLATAVFGVGSCTTFNNARPLQPGEHAVAVTGGGALVRLPGDIPTPIPNITLEGRHGLLDGLDVNYGVHLLPALFGVPGAHVGTSVLLLDQLHPAAPAVSAGQRLFLFSNLLDDRKAARDTYLLSQTDLTLSWLAFDQLVYAGGTGYLQLGGGPMRFAPFIGVELKPAALWEVDWVRLQLEARWGGPDVDQRFAVVNWIAPDHRGAIFLNAGLAFVFGGAER
jgi:hypothetical protein